jgi:hypothetical protein
VRHLAHLRRRDGDTSSRLARVARRELCARSACGGSPWGSTAGTASRPRRVRELRARVKAAPASVAATPGLAETLVRDWQKAGRFYVKLGISEAMVRDGVASVDSLPRQWEGSAGDMPCRIRAQ